MHLSAGSPCRGAGSMDYVTGVDIDGEAWANPPSIGCDEFYSGVITGSLSIAIQSDYTNVAPGFPINFTGHITGHAGLNVWDFGDGMYVTNQLAASHCWLAAEDYLVTFTAFNDSNPGGVSATLLVHVVEEIHYVDIGSTNPVAPYTSWDTAATNIQDAVDAAVLPGASVIVTNGVYASGGRTVGAQTNRVVITQFVQVQSVNGPTATAIQGYQEPDTTNGYDTVRCVYLADSASLAGFTLTQGATRPDTDWWVPDYEQSGGGVWCETSGSLVSNCVFSGNSAANNGGGVANGTLINCTLTNDTAANGGGTYDSTLVNCTLIANYSGNGGGACGDWWNPPILSNCMFYNNTADGSGGGADNSTLNNCTLTGNSAANSGGGASSSTLNNCDLTDNWVGGISATASIKGSKPSGPTPMMLTSYFGGGADSSILNNCTLVGNQAIWGEFGTGAGGGADNSTLNNCIVTDNGADFGGGAENSTLNNCTLTGNSAGINFGGADSSILNNCIVYYNTNGDYFNSSLNYCCTAQPPDNGIGNITNEPAFVNLAGGDFHLQPDSPCINAGNNSFVTTTNDLAGNPRIVGGTVDMGAYEYQTPTSIISYAWLQQYGLPTDGSADFIDSDGDGMNNWQEWIAGTDPTDPSSLLKMMAVTNDVSGMTVTWQSVSGVTYFLQRSTDLGAQPAFSTIQTDIAGQPGTTSYTDTDATSAGPYFYRVGVQQ
jgi:hypothetical protein